MAISSDKVRDVGLLIGRIGLGAMMAGVHGWPKLIGGPERWAKLGGAMKSLGVTWQPEVWGLAAALAESVGGLLVVVGLFTRPAAAVIVFTMFVAANRDLQGGTLADAAHPIETGLGFLLLTLLGAGRYSVDARWRGKG